MDEGRDDGGPIVIGVDLGTTSTKTVAYDTDGRALASTASATRSTSREPGHAVQDPQLILDAVVESMRGTLASAGGRRGAGLLVQHRHAQPDRPRPARSCRSPRS